MLLITLPIFLTGCYTHKVQRGVELDPAKVARLSEGMIKREVITLLGLPLREAVTQDGEEAWIYESSEEQDRTRFFGLWSEQAKIIQKRTLSVIFEGGIVKTFKFSSPTDAQGVYR